MHILAKLKRDLAEITGKIGAMLDLEAKGNLSDEQKTEFGALEAQKADIEAKIGRREKHIEDQKKLTDVGNDAGNAVDIGAAQTVRARSLDDAKRGFKHFGEFAGAVRAMHDPSIGVRDERLLNIQAATGMSQGSGSDGGFLVPPGFSNVIWDGMREDDANLLELTDRYTVEGESLTFPGVDETSRATGSRWGGVRAYWLSEAAQITASRPKFRQVKLEPKQLAVLIYATDKLLKNPIALEQFLTRAAISEIGFLVSDAIIEGDGSGKPLGILDAPATVTVAKESGQANDTIVYANILKMWSRCHARWRKNAAWLINQEVETQLNSMTVAVGTGGAPVYLPAGGISENPYATLMGRPVRPIEFCSALGDKGDIILANLQGYCAGTKGGIDSAMSMHLKFDYAETAFRFMFEADGQPWLASALTPFKATAGNTLSPFVTLAAR